MDDFQKLQDHLDGVERELDITEAREEFLVVGIDRDGTVHVKTDDGIVFSNQLLHLIVNGRKPDPASIPKVGDKVMFVPWGMVDEVLDKQGKIS